MEYALSQSVQCGNQDCVVLGFCSEIQFGHQLKLCSEEFVTQVTELSQKLAEKGDWVWQTNLQGPNVLLFHCGAQNEFSGVYLEKSLLDIVQLLLKLKIKRAQLSFPPVFDHSSDWQIKQMVLIVDAQCYQFNDYKTSKTKNIALESLTFCLSETDEDAFKMAKATAEGIRLTRWLADLPANRCTPTFLAEQAQLLNTQHKNIKVTVFGLEEMKKMGMGALLAVAQGSNEPPKFIEINYMGASEDEAPIALIGKGITFDSGGLSIKLAQAMEEMKYDMAGAASVIGTIKACALLELPINIIGLIPSTENLPSGTAIKPGDVVTSLSGQTIEIINTDAEGRLILADALTYAERYHPSLVIDIATLTGAIIIALGYINTGFMTPDEELADIITKSARESNDRAWRLPLDDTYQEALDSPIADMLNATFDRSAGSITAACFLARFAKNLRWAHLDIAGTAWISGRKRQATGRPVPLLVELIHHVMSTR